MEPSAEALEEFARAYPRCGAADRALILEQNRLLPGGRGAVGSGAQANNDRGWSLWRTEILSWRVGRSWSSRATILSLKPQRDATGDGGDMGHEHPPHHHPYDEGPTGGDDPGSHAHPPAATGLVIRTGSSIRRSPPRVWGW